MTEFQEEGDGGSAKERTVSLDSRDYRYASYLLGVKRRIENVWGYPAEARAIGLTGSLLVVFTIERDGRLGSLELVEGSGARILDDEAVGAIRRAAPYTPFPVRMAFERLRIRASFNYLAGFSLLRGSRSGEGRP